MKVTITLNRTEAKELLVTMKASDEMWKDTVKYPESQKELRAARRFSKFYARAIREIEEQV